MIAVWIDKLNPLSLFKKVVTFSVGRALFCENSEAGSCSTSFFQGISTGCLVHDILKEEELILTIIIPISKRRVWDIALPRNIPTSYYM